MTYLIQDLDPYKDQVFTHIDSDDPYKQTTWAINRLILAKEYLALPLVIIPVDKNGHDLLVKNRGTEPHRLARINISDWISYPLTFADMEDGTHLLIDGTHRYVAYYNNGLREAMARLVPKSIWSNHLVTDMFDVPLDKIDQFKDSFSGIR